MKKKFFRKLGVSILATLCLVSLSACTPKNQQKKIKVSSSMSNNGQYFSSNQQNAQMKGQQVKALKNVSGQMSKNYKKIGKVNYQQNKNTINLNLTGSQMESLTQYAQQGNKQAMKFWKQLTTGMKKTSTNLSKQLQDNSLKFQIYSPDNKLIYSVSNGNVSKNAYK